MEKLLHMFAWVVSSFSQMKARSERGAAAVEYGLLVALIAAVIVLAVTALGNGINGTFCSVVTALGFSSSSCAATP